jgi:hypothetical protein
VNKKFIQIEKVRDFDQINEDELRRASLKDENVICIFQFWVLHISYILKKKYVYDY